MPISVLRARVKEKCGVPDTSYDTTIDNLIAEQVPVIEYAIDPAFLADTNLIPILNLGATEIVCGEFLAQQAREPGATEGFAFNGLEVYARKNQDDPDKLRTQGASRLAPYLRTPSAVFAIQGKESDE